MRSLVSVDLVEIAVSAGSTVTVALGSNNDAAPRDANMYLVFVTEQ